MIVMVILYGTKYWSQRIIAAMPFWLMTNICIYTDLKREDGISMGIGKQALSIAAMSFLLSITSVVMGKVYRVLMAKLVPLKFINEEDARDYLEYHKTLLSKDPMELQIISVKEVDDEE